MDIRRRSLLSETLHGGGSNEEAINIDNYLTIEAIEDGLTASLSVNTCEYCVDGDGNWKSLSADTATESINAGQTLSFRSNLTPNISDGIGRFSINKKCNLKGNCMSILFVDEAANNFSLSGKNSVFYGLFKNCANIISVSNDFLPATTLAEYCYRSMFQGCSSLTTAPELPATTLASECYDSMFYGCTSLTTAPELPVTTLATYCYRSMFYGCTSLTTAPELPATTLVDSCYGAMFYNCSKLNNIKMLATLIPESSCLNNWVYGVASSGTFIKHPDMRILPINEWSSAGIYMGTSGIPEGWTVINDGEESVGGGGLNITVPLDDSGYGEFTNEQIEQITNYCLQFGESNASGKIPNGFSLAINSIPIDNIAWTQYNGETIIHGSADVRAEFSIGLGDKYIQFK